MSLPLVYVPPTCDWWTDPDGPKVPQRGPDPKSYQLHHITDTGVWCFACPAAMKLNNDAAFVAKISQQIDDWPGYTQRTILRWRTDLANESNVSTDWIATTHDDSLVEPSRHMRNRPEWYEWAAARKPA